MRILKESTTGLVIDIQERLFPHIDGHEDLLLRVKILVSGLQILDIPVLYTEQYRKGLGETLKPIQDLASDFSPMEKMSFSCCDEDGIWRKLKDKDKKFIVIAGIETHVCVLQTAIDLISAGMVPVVIADCVSSRKKMDKELAIERLRQEGAYISSAESVLFELARVSGTETFKKISRLVK